MVVDTLKRPLPDLWVGTLALPPAPVDLVVVSAAALVAEDDSAVGSKTIGHMAGAVALGIKAAVVVLEARTANLLQMHHWGLVAAGELVVHRMEIWTPGVSRIDHPDTAEAPDMTGPPIHVE